MVTALGDAATPSDVVPRLLVGRERPPDGGGCGRVHGRRGVQRRCGYAGDRPACRIVLQMTGVIVLTPLLDVAAGGLLGRFQSELVRNAGILILIPPFVSQSGALEASSPPVSHRRSRSASCARPCGRTPSPGWMRRSCPARARDVPGRWIGRDRAGGSTRAPRSLGDDRRHPPRRALAAARVAGAVVRRRGGNGAARPRPGQQSRRARDAPAAWTSQVSPRCSW